MEIFLRFIQSLTVEDMLGSIVAGLITVTIVGIFNYLVFLRTKRQARNEINTFFKKWQKKLYNAKAIKCSNIDLKINKVQLQAMIQKERLLSANVLISIKSRYLTEDEQFTFLNSIAEEVKFLNWLEHNKAQLDDEKRYAQFFEKLDKKIGWLDLNLMCEAVEKV